MNWDWVDFQSILIKLIIPISAAIGGYAARIFKIKSPIKRLWKINDIKNLIICLAESKPVGIKIDSDDPAANGQLESVRPVTGIGQVKALAEIVENMSKAYPLSIKNISFASEVFHNNIEKDLIIIGGPNTNKMAENFFNIISSLNIVELVGNSFIWKKGDITTYKSTKRANGVTTDYGLIVRMPNPFETNKKSTLCLFAGCHTMGTVAAAKYFTESYLKEHKPWNIFDYKSPKTVFILVECTILDRETYPINIIQKRIYEE